MLLANLECFSVEELEKIRSMEPDKGVHTHAKSRYGKILDTSDFQTSGLTLFKTRNKTKEKYND
jgi:quinolinate synthase